MRAHVIADGIVVNTIEVESLDFAPNLINGDIGGIGWRYEQGNLLPPVKTINKDQVNATIIEALEAIDRKSIRALREGDQERIEMLEDQAATLRAQLVKD